MTCNKKAYTSWQHASNDAKRLRRHQGRQEEPYYCKPCQAFHVGSSGKKMRVEKRIFKASMIQEAAE